MVTRVSTEMVEGLADELAGKQTDLGLSGKATAEDYRSGEPDKALEPAGVWEAAGFVPLPFAASIAIDLNDGFNRVLTMTGNGTLANPAGKVPGKSGVIEIIQDATGGRLLTFGSDWRFPGGAAPALSTAPNARDVLSFICLSDGSILAAMANEVP